MSRMYKTYPIKIDGSSLDDFLSTISFSDSDAALNYEAQIAAVLDTIVSRTNGIGQKVLSRLPKNKTLVIVPYDAASAKIHGDCNATAADATILESGNARIRFTPASWGTGGVCSAITTRGIGSSTDEILLHEILHAFRKVRGTYNAVALNGPDKAYDSIEELFAILITNIYMSENGKTKFRKDHAGFSELPAKWATSEDFIKDKDYFHWVEYFWIVEKSLTSAIADSGARFNPFRAFKAYEDAKEAAMNSSF